MNTDEHGLVIFFLCANYSTGWTPCTLWASYPS